MRPITLVATLALCATANAETTVPSGQPLCTTLDRLRAYILAMIEKDRARLNQIDGCAMVKGGLRMEVIDKGEATSGMHIDKVRVFGAKGSGVGYTMTVDR